METLLSLWTPCGAVPDFLTPLPLSSRPRFGDELRRVRETPPEQIKRDLALTYDELPPGLQGLYRRPGSGIDRLVRLIDAYWERTLADHWPRLRHVLEGDLVYRTRALAAGGAMAVFDDLHERVAWESGDVVIGSAEPPTEPDYEVDVLGGGLLLLPSAFIWPFVATVFRSPSEPAVAYPSRGIGTLWQAEPAAGPEALAGPDRPHPGRPAGDARCPALDERGGAALRAEHRRRLAASRGPTRFGARHLAATRPRDRALPDTARALAARGRRRRPGRGCRLAVLPPC